MQLPGRSGDVRSTRAARSATLIVELGSSCTGAGTRVKTVISPRKMCREQWITAVTSHVRWGWQRGLTGLFPLTFAPSAAPRCPLSVAEGCGLFHFSLFTYLHLIPTPCLQLAHWPQHAVTGRSHKQASADWDRLSGELMKPQPLEGAHTRWDKAPTVPIQCGLSSYFEQQRGIRTSSHPFWRGFHQCCKVIHLLFPQPHWLSFELHL